VRGTAKAPSARPTTAMFTELRMRFGIAAALLAVIALALPAFASADPLGSVALYNAGLRAEASIQVVTAGPDGNVWFIDTKAAGPPAIGRVKPSGEITEFVSGTNLSGLGSEPDLVAIATGPGEKLWFTDKGATPAIGVIDPATCTSSCTAEEFPIKEKGGNEGAKPQGIVTYGGNLWFTDMGTTPAIGKIDPGTHEVKEFSIKAEGGNEGARPHGIVAGSDGNLWFNDLGSITQAIGKINPSTHAVNEFATGAGSAPGSGSEAGPWGIAAGSDGNVWFTEGGTNTTEGRSVTGKAIGRITPSGTISYFSSELITSSFPLGLTAAPDGNLWFTDKSGVSEKQTISFSSATNEQEFKVCNEAKCEIFKYKTVGKASEKTTLINRVRTAYEAAYGAGTVLVGGGTNTCGGNCSLTVSFEEGSLTNTNVAKAACEKVSGTGTCSTETTTDGVPSAVGSITTSGTIARYPINGLPSVAGITNGPDGNVWFAVGAGPTQKMGKFGIEPPLTLKVTKTGTGTGTVTSSPSGINCGSECSASFTSGEEVTLTAAEDEGSEFTGWSGGGCSGTGTCKVKISGFSEIEVKANFDKTGPTNLLPLTVTKSAGGTGGVGTVSSKPKGINCGSACNEAAGSFYKESSVLLTAKPASGSTFVKWEGGDCAGNVTTTCTVGMDKAEEVKAVFGGTSKAITEPKGLTVSKGKSSGKGTVKASGLYCEADCTQTTVLYQGPIGGPKPKPAKTVELSAAAVYGSEFTGWSGGGCSGKGTCVVTMNEATTVTATFTAKASGTLTVNKNSYETGTGTVSSKPKAIKCATTCTTQSASVPQGESILLSAKPATGMTFVKWEGDDCEGNVTTTCTVTMDASETVKAVFSGAPKAIAEAKALTLKKAGKGFGTVKASGLACEALCTSTASLYQGPIGGPKPKEAKTVTLEAISAPGSKKVAWSGCDSVTEGKCVVLMSTAKEVTATFDELK
jgi:streptogramin lyase